MLRESGARTGSSRHTIVESKWLRKEGLSGRLPLSVSQHEFDFFPSYCESMDVFVLVNLPHFIHIGSKLVGYEYNISYLIHFSQGEVFYFIRSHYW